MIKRARLMTMVVFLLTVFFMAGSAFAGRSEFEAMRKLEEDQKPKIQEKIVKPKAEYTAKGLRDPFQTPFVGKSTSGSGAVASGPGGASLGLLKLQGVIWGGKFPQAIINNRVVKIGDTIERALVVDINRYGVVLFLDGSQYTLSSPMSEIGPYRQSGGVE